MSKYPQMDQFLSNINSSKNNNTNKLIIENETLLLILDMQEKLITSVKDNQLIIFNINKLINTCDLLNVDVAITEQNPLKLGKTINSISFNEQFPVFKKMEFSCSKNNNLIDYLNKNNFKNIIICGIESHICILQSSLDLIERGYNILIPRDAIGSRNTIDNETAFLRLILSGAIASTTESLICELCKTSDRIEFRDVSKILKSKFLN